MSAFLEKISAATQAAPRESMTVAEWGGVEIYWRPPSLAKREEIQRRAGKSDSRATAVTVLLLATDAEGNRLFADDDLAGLESLDGGEVVGRVAKEMLGIEEAETAGEQSAPTPG